jgi:hypothetical protein
MRQRPPLLSARDGVASGVDVERIGLDIASMIFHYIPIASV